MLYAAINGASLRAIHCLPDGQAMLSNSFIVANT
jgi:hypothetical protein